MLDGVISSAIDMTSGVPQNSILGPLLPLLSVNPLADSLSPILIQMFVDYIIYWKLVYNNRDMLTLQCDADQIVDRVENSLLKLNVKKTLCPVISRKRKLPKPLLVVNGELTELLSSYKYQEVIITNNLKGPAYCSGLLQGKKATWIFKTATSS